MCGFELIGQQLNDGGRGVPLELRGQEMALDHNDPSKPSHRLTNGPEPSKTIESDGSNIKKPS